MNKVVLILIVAVMGCLIESKSIAKIGKTKTKSTISKIGLNNLDSSQLPVPLYGGYDGWNHFGYFAPLPYYPIPFQGHPWVSSPPTHFYGYSSFPQQFHFGNDLNLDGYNDLGYGGLIGGELYGTNGPNGYYYGTHQEYQF